MKEGGKSYIAEYKASAQPRADRRQATDDRRQATTGDKQSRTADSGQATNRPTDQQTNRQTDKHRQSAATETGSVPRARRNSRS